MTIQEYPAWYSCIVIGAPSGPQGPRGPRDPRDPGPRDPRDPGPRDPRDAGPRDPRDPAPWDLRDPFRISFVVSEGSQIVSPTLHTCQEKSDHSVARKN